MLAARLDAGLTGDAVRLTVHDGRLVAAKPAFGGALVHGLLSGWEPARCAEYANAAGALVAARLACADAMPTVEELEAMVAGRWVAP